MNIESIFEKEASRNSWSHAYLFVGTGREKIQKAIDFIISQKKILPEDICRLEPENETGKAGEIKKEDVKRLIHEISLTPIGPARLAIIEDCEKLNQSSANILLKSIEEPPKNVVFVLISSTSQVISTIKSRCRVYIVPSMPILEELEFEPNEFFQGSFLQAGKMIDQIVKKGIVDKFINNIIFSERQNLIITKNPKKALLLEFVQKIKNDINNNASVKLALECLWLQSKKLESS